MQFFKAELTTINRSEFLQFIEQDNRADWRGEAPRFQIMYDVGYLNNIERQEDDEIPLQIYLQNAAFFLSGLPVRGAPRRGLSQMSEMKEAIIFTDDMVTCENMACGVKSVASVMNVRIPSIESKESFRTANSK